MARFKMVTLKIYHLDESMAMLVLKRGLRPSCFTYFLNKTFLKSYSKMLANAQKYILADEAALTRCRIDKKSRKKA